jgi:hypothetical protein
MKGKTVAEKVTAIPGVASAGFAAAVLLQQIQGALAAGDIQIRRLLRPGLHPFYFQNNSLERRNTGCIFRTNELASPGKLILEG